MTKGKSGHPRKRFYRARAHSNPLNDSQFPVPISPCYFDWSQHFPDFLPKPDSEGKIDVGLSPDEQSKRLIDVQLIPDEQSEKLKTVVVDRKVRFADIGCGFGGLLVTLSTLFPRTLIIGMELRDKVSEYVKERIDALRMENPGNYQNISVVRTNVMKYLQNYFEKGQLHKMFFLFPDPHFKERNHRRRVISLTLLAEYAHVMAVGGVLYTITDVQELGEWMKSCLDAHPLFEELALHEQELDPVVKLLVNATEEGQKVERNGGKTYRAVYQRVNSENDCVS